MTHRLALALVLVAATASAQIVRVPPVRTVATLGTCTDTQPKIVAVTDGATSSDCATGGGTYDVTCYCANGAWSAAASAAGTVTSVSVSTANGVSGTVANATTTPALTIALGAITPTSVAASGDVTGANLQGTNTGDQTTITGNAGTATALAANGANCDAGSYPLGVDASGAAEGCTVAGGGGGGIGGSVGSTDNAIPRADGTGGATLQSSSATIDDSGYLTATRFQVAGSSAAFRDNAGSVQLDTEFRSSSYSRGAVWHVEYPSADSEIRFAYCWSNDYDWAATDDLCIKRNAVGVFEVNGGTTSTGAALFVRPLASPPSCVEGTSYYDSSDHDWCDCVGASPAWRSRGAGSCS